MSLSMPGTWPRCLLATSDEGWEDWTQEDVPGWQNAETKAQSCVSFSCLLTSHHHVPISMRSARLPLGKNGSRPDLELGLI